MPRINRTRKQIRDSEWFTENIRLRKSPLDSITISRGLVNPGNFCYFNSCLQCLAHCEPFAKVMFNGKHDKQAVKFCSLCAMKRITKQLLREEKEPLSTTEFALNSVKLNPRFKIGTQQDAHELLTSLISKMALEEKYGCGSSSYDNQQHTENRPNSLIENVFNFTTKTSVTCSKCQTTTETEDECQNLCLQITKPNKEVIESVGEALDYYFGTEELTGENAYMCEKCNERVEAKKRVSLQTGPNVLVIGLGRNLVDFDPTTKQVLSKKLNHFVKFNKRLDVTSHMHGMEEKHELALGGNQYRLSGFCYHIGACVNSGHYISSVFLPGGKTGEKAGKWVVKNDEDVKKVRFKGNAKVYLLFYSREDSQPPQIGPPKKKAESAKRNSLGKLKEKKKNDEKEAEAEKKKTTEFGKREALETGKSEAAEREEEIVETEEKQTTEEEEEETAQTEEEETTETNFLFSRIDTPRRENWGEGEEVGEDEKDGTEATLSKDNESSDEYE